MFSTLGKLYRKFISEKVIDLLGKEIAILFLRMFDTSYKQTVQLKESIFFEKTSIRKVKKNYYRNYFPVLCCVSLFHIAA